MQKQKINLNKKTLKYSLIGLSLVIIASTISIAFIGYISSNNKASANQTCEAGLTLNSAGICVDSENPNNNLSDTSEVNFSSVKPSRLNDSVNLSPEWRETLSSNNKRQSEEKSSQVKLANVKLQESIPNYACSANYINSSTSATISALAADGQGNVYSAGYDYLNNVSVVDKFNNVGVKSSINVPAELLTGRVVANAAGDAYQITYESLVGNYHVYRIPNGTTNYNKIYTINGSSKYVSPNSLQIDSAGNLYIIYDIVSNLINSITLGTQIDKISSTGTLLSTFTLPSITSFNLQSEYKLRLNVSTAGLIFVATIPNNQTSSTNISLSILVLNTNGTEKGRFEYSPSSQVEPNRLSEELITMPTSVVGGGVMVSYMDNSNYLRVKRILDTDTFPVSSTPTFSVNYSTSLNTLDEAKVLTDSTNTFAYIQFDGSFSRVNISNGAQAEMAPLFYNNVMMVNNSSNQLIIALSYSTNDLFRIDCSTPYSAVTVTSQNLTLNYCNQQVTNTAEQNVLYCLYSLRKGLSFNLPTHTIKIGSSINNNPCIIVTGVTESMGCNALIAPINSVSSPTQFEFNTNGGAYSNINTYNILQPFSAWSPNAITLAGKTEEIIYNNRLYQAAVGTDRGLYLRSADSNGVFNNWSRLSSITALGTPVLSIDPAGELYVFARGTDNGLYFWKVGEAGGERWRRVGTITIKDLPSLHNFNSKYWLFATGTDNVLYTAKYISFNQTAYTTPVWSTIGGLTTTKTAVGGVVDSTLFQIALGTDNAIYFRSMGTPEVFNTWVRYDRFTYSDMSKPVVVNNKMWFGARDAKFKTNYIVDDFTNLSLNSFSESLNSIESSNFSAFNGLVVEAGAGIDNRLYHRNDYGTWIQGNFITVLNSPTQVTFNGKQYQFVRGTDNKLWTRIRS
jgi:hypothetical protein